MLADTKRELSTALGILHRGEGVPLRATFIVDRQGVIRWASVNDLSVGRNVDEVLRVLDALKTGELCPCNWKAGEPTLQAASRGRARTAARRHSRRKPIYGEKPAGLMALAVNAINGCEMCVRAHEKTVTEGGLTPDHVNDAVRIAATVYAAAVALEAGESGADDPAVIEVAVQGA